MDQLMEMHVPDLDVSAAVEAMEAAGSDADVSADADPKSVSGSKRLRTRWAKKAQGRTSFVHLSEDEFRAHVTTALGEERARPVLAFVDGDPLTAAERMELDLKKLAGTPAEPVVEIFRKKPARAIDFLVNEGIVEDDLEAIANWLFEYRYVLDPVQMGEYLSSKLDEDSPPEERDMSEILSAYVRNIPFEHLNFDLALRRYLYCFKLPGEAQRIDRMMRKFAAHYYETFPDTLYNSYIAVYRMAFSIIMLNTDAHNDNVFEKMNLKQFIRNCEGINDDEDLPLEYLEDMYQRIYMEEISFTREDARMPDAVRKDWLHVIYNNKMRRRWLVLTNNCLLVFRKIEDVKPCQYILLQNVRVNPVCNQKGRRYCIRLQDSTADVEQDKGSYLILSAASERDVTRWTAALESQIIRD
eukprot:TRINITY_DN1895_c0_g1_i1.p1 TRINITY_DN1895_c0_g1~~TRINITY_DN1895_c0_g1_i1.p1  ORF type:complete len:459 (+),score=150.04 TRINITY_DN1895_c0_g1_i1:140-1378(+)